MIWLRALLFVVFVQVTVVGLVPYELMAIDVGPTLALAGARFVGFAPLVLGVAMLLWCNVAFVARGHGTAAPYDPPRDLVVVGLYRWLRNPMYVSAVLIVVGEALLAQAPVLLAYAGALAVAYDLFVRHYEEPRLRRAFGESYARYCTEVPRWIPRPPRVGH